MLWNICSHNSSGMPAKELYIETVKRIGTHKTNGKVQHLNYSIAIMREEVMI